MSKMSDIESLMDRVCFENKHVRVVCRAPVQDTLEGFPDWFCKADDEPDGYATFLLRMDKPWQGLNSLILSENEIESIEVIA